MIAGLASSPAEASTGPFTSSVTASAAVSTTSSTGGVLVAERVAAASTTQVEALTSAQAAAKAAAAKKAAHKRAAKKAAARKAAARKAAARKAAAKKAAAAHRRAVALRRLGLRVVRVASTYKGRPYQWGATGPSRFDCSGFTRYIYAKFGVSLPHSSAGQYSVVQHISNSRKQIGDLVFFHTSGGHVYHVGIYAGGDVIWAATHTGDFVRLEGMWNASYYVGRV